MKCGPAGGRVQAEKLIMPLLRSFFEGGTKQVDNLRVVSLPIGTKGSFECEHMSVGIKVLVVHQVGHGSSKALSGR